MGCAKKRYKDELAAKIALALMKGKADRGNTRRRETRAYRCPACKGWHTTSQV